MLQVRAIAAYMPSPASDMQLTTDEACVIATQLQEVPTALPCSGLMPVRYHRDGHHQVA